MSEQGNKRYYWLKLKRDFFKRHDIRIIESQPNGKDYVLFYLKMLVESIDHEGELRFSDAIPYDENMLSVITNTNVDIVRAAMAMFINLHMIELFDDKTIFMSEVERLTGSETAAAVRVRKHRAINSKHPALLQCNSEVTKCNTEKEKEKEKEKETKTPPTPRGGDKRFDQFWEAYPRKTAKENARKAFAKHKFNDDTLHTVLEALNTQKTSDQWQKEGGQFIPYAATWLNQRRWEDDLPTPAGEVNWAVPS